MADRVLRVTHAPAQPSAPDLQRLYYEHAPFVRALARHLLGSTGDSDDVTQEVFVLAWKKLQTCQVHALRAWLAEITVRVVSGARRRAWFVRTLGLEHAREEIDWNTPEQAAENREALRELDAALRCMSERLRTVFVLFEVHGFSGQEVAEMLQCSLNSVHTRLFRARREFFARVGHASLIDWSTRRSLS